jgi:arylsulfatase A-like enzyme
VAGDTLVVYTTDHGELLGNHGLYLKGPMPYEDLLRVGMVVRGPGVQPGKRGREPVSTLDLAATFYDIRALRRTGAAGPQPAALAGERGRDAQRGLQRVACASFALRRRLKLRTVRTRTHKCTFELDSGPASSTIW